MRQYTAQGTILKTLQKGHMFVREMQGQEVEEGEDKVERAVRESGSKAGVDPSPYC